ncbi:hypothetical protein ASF81_14170 [Brevundimonas sp. Leaf168]|nr:hypothetical protein ASF81_14170 [Brevundimonas sp. Leaf168]
MYATQYSPARGAGRRSRQFGISACPRSRFKAGSAPSTTLTRVAIARHSFSGFDGDVGITSSILTTATVVYSRDMSVPGLGDRRQALAASGEASAAQMTRPVIILIAITP